MADIASPAAVADYILAECRERGEVLTNLKLQKLLFYSQAWRLALTGEPLFEEDFEAWVHGPVLPSQYLRFRDFKWRPILVDVQTPDLTEELREHLDEVIDVFGPETAVALEAMTHQERPWLEARGGLPLDAPSNAKISKAAMADYYSSLT